MAEFILRPAVERDREKIISIFQASFGDGEAFVRELIEKSGRLSSACCGEMDGEVRSCMFAFNGISFEGRSVSYLYALCTEHAYRGMGMGKAVTQYSARRAYEKGADGVFLLAADEGLQRWYISAMGASPMLAYAPLRRRIIPAEQKAEAISPEEYFRLRGGKWQLPMELIMAQHCVNRHFGGAFLRKGEDCLCAEIRDGVPLVRELKAIAPEDMLAAAAAYFGVEELDILLPQSEGKALLFLPPRQESFPPSAPPFPFLLD